jgi:hypothetical protein
VSSRTIRFARSFRLRWCSFRRPALRLHASSQVCGFHGALILIITLINQLEELLINQKSQAFLMFSEVLKPGPSSNVQTFLITHARAFFCGELKRKTDLKGGNKAEIRSAAAALHGTSQTSVRDLPEDFLVRARIVLFSSTARHTRGKDSRRRAVRLAFGS